VAEAEPSASGSRLDHVSTVLLAVAAVATAWATYQSAHWRSEQALAGNRSTAARVESNRAAGAASREALVDVETFTQWVDAYYSGDSELAAFYFRRFRPEFRPAVTAWIATRPLANPQAPLTPFAMPEYASAALEEAERLDAKADAESATAQSHVLRADRYTLCVVLFAMALFFAGISTRLRDRGSRAAVLGIGCVVFGVGLVWLLTFPVALRL
jgi:hypothetical protein